MEKEECVSCGMIDNLEKGVCRDCRELPDMDIDDTETYYVNVSMNLHINLPADLEHPEYSVEQLVTQMACHHDDLLCCAVDVDHQINGTASQIKAESAAKAL